MTETTAKRGGKLILLLLVVAVVVLAIIYLPLQEALDWVEGLGAWGPLALGLIYVLSCVLFVPGFILTVGAGFLFGVVQGTIVVSLASTLGATLACLVGRYLARDQIARMVEGNDRFAAVDTAVAREGFKIVLLTRLSPIFPFNLLNFAYGLTRVPIGHYMLASWIGMLPGTIMYVYFGSVAEDVATVGSGEKTTAEWALTIVGFAAAVIVTVFVTRIARRALRDAAPEAAA
jgi:uncharacterized membrane protein YdjX (TVP38/TMEM64 family)